MKSEHLGMCGFLLILLVTTGVVWGQCPPLYTLEGEAIGDMFGEHVSDAGDVNNDGYDDFIVGAPFNNELGYYTGKAYVYSGLDGSLLHEFTGESDYDFFGTTVSCAGDVNGDSHDDLLIGASQATGTSSWGNGIAYVYSGADYSLLYKIHGEAENDRFGMYDISDAGDVNNDGFADFIVGAGYNDALGNRIGRAYVFFGGSGPFPSLANAIDADMVITGSVVDGGLGFSIAGAGLVNDDDYGDLLIGAWNPYGVARVYVYSGVYGSVLYEFIAETSGDAFGYSVSAGDINGDDVVDFLVGAYRHSTPGKWAGCAYVFYGRAGSYPITVHAGDADLIITGEYEYDQFGKTVSVVGDVNQDGFDDIAVGADGYGGYVGRTYVYSGCDGELLHVFDGEGATEYEQFGHSVSGAGDVNNDGMPDLIVGARSHTGRGPGWAYVLSFAEGRVLGQVSADCPDSGTGLQGVIVDLYDSEGQLIASELTTEDGSYCFTDIPQNGDYTVAIVVPIGLHAELQEVPVWVGCAEVTGVGFNLTCADIPTELRGLGYWVHQVNSLLKGKDTQESWDDMCLYMELIRTHFNLHGLNPVSVFEVDLESDCQQRLEALRATISPTVPSTMNERARAHLTVLLLNMVSAKIGQWAVISEDGATVSQAITYCNAMISDDNPDNDEMAKDIAEMINEGTTVPASMIDLSTPTYVYKAGGVPKDFALSQNYPNPFNPSTEISFSLPHACHVELEIFNVKGQKVSTLVNREMETGHHTISFDGSKAASGVYLYRLKAGDFVESKKMLLVK